MKKSAMLLSSVLIGISILSGCSKSDKTIESSAPQATGSPQETTKAKEVTLKYYNWDNEAVAFSTAKLIEQFQAENPNIKVESIPLVPGNSVDSLKKLDITMSSGAPTDVFMLPNSDEVTARAAQGVIAPLDELYAKDNVKPEDEYYLNPKLKGSTYAAMFSRSQWVVFLNKDALDEANLPIPQLGWTWDDFREYAKKLNKGEGNDKRYGAYFHSWGDYADSVLFAERKNPFLKEDGTTQFDDPSILSFFNLRRAMEKDDKSVKPFADIIGAKLAYRTEFFNEKAAMVFTGSWMVGESTDLTKYPRKFKIAFAPTPRSTKDAEEGLTTIGGTFLSIAANSKNKEEAYKFVRFMTTNTSDAKTDLPGWKKADDKKTFETTIAKVKDTYDLDSMDKAFFDKRIHSAGASEVVAPYASQLKKVLEDGFSKFILNNQKAEDAQKELIDAANKLISENKK